jgi:hypothetical protein
MSPGLTPDLTPDPEHFVKIAKETVPPPISRRASLRDLLKSVATNSGCEEKRFASPFTSRLTPAMTVFWGTP